MTNQPRISIYVSSHKGTEYVHNDIFLPIQVGAGIEGRAKLPGFLYDNSGDNISCDNARFCELTAQYWAWKQQPQVDYVGFFHYRRYLSFNTPLKDAPDIWGSVIGTVIDDAAIQKYGLTEEKIRSVVSNYDIILPEAKSIKAMPKMGKNAREQYTGSGFLHAGDLEIMLDVLKEKYPEFVPYAQRFLASSKIYLNNVFIMRKEIFDEYSAWLFDILQECDRRIDYTDYSTEAIRTPGHLAERLLNIYILYLRDKFSYKIKELPTVVFLETSPLPDIRPAFTENNIAIAMSANDFYAPFIATALASIRENSSSQYSYDILILHSDITPRNQARIKQLFSNRPNFSVRFIDATRFKNRFASLFLRGHFTIETWYRLLLPDILPHYDRLLYLDSDLVVEADVADLYNTDIDGYLLVACRDADTAGLYNGAEPGKKDYMDNILKIKKPYEYFQAGVILFNLAEFRKAYKTKDVLQFAASYDWELLDQDVLNYLAQGRVKFIDMSWNSLYDWRGIRIEKNISLAPKYLQDEYLAAHQNPKIIHYAGPDKPWDDPQVDHAERFWKYCRQSNFYEVVIKRMCCVNTSPSRAKSLCKKVAKKILPANTKRGRTARVIFSKLRG